MTFAFDPRDWHIVPERSFSQLKIGEIFRAPSRTLTDARASAFQTAAIVTQERGKITEGCR